jgi:hypothetical protein
MLKSNLTNVKSGLEFDDENIYQILVLIKWNRKTGLTFYTQILAFKLHNWSKDAVKSISLQTHQNTLKMQKIKLQKPLA